MLGREAGGRSPELLSKHWFCVRAGGGRSTEGCHGVRDRRLWFGILSGSPQGRVAKAGSFFGVYNGFDAKHCCCHRSRVERLRRRAARPADASCAKLG
jgi:hypothetical protein